MRTDAEMQMYARRMSDYFVEHLPVKSCNFDYLRWDPGSLEIFCNYACWKFSPNSVQGWANSATRGYYFIGTYPADIPPEELAKSAIDQGQAEVWDQSFYRGEKLMKANDTQVGGNHYKANKVEPWDSNFLNGMGFIEGSVIKYVTRYNQTGNILDLRKAKHYIEKRIELHNESTLPSVDESTLPSVEERLENLTKKKKQLNDEEISELLDNPRINLAKVDEGASGLVERPPADPAVKGFLELSQQYKLDVLYNYHVWFGDFSLTLQKPLIIRGFDMSKLTYENLDTIITVMYPDCCPELREEFPQVIKLVAWLYDKIKSVMEEQENAVK